MRKIRFRDRLDLARTLLALFFARGLEVEEHAYYDPPEEDGGQHVFRRYELRLGLPRRP